MNTFNYTYNICKITIFIGCLFLFVSSNLAIENFGEYFNRGPLGGNVQAIAVDPDNPDIVYVGTYGGGFYWSNNSRNAEPATWKQENTGLSCWNILCLMVKNRQIYAGTTQGIFYLDRDMLQKGIATWEEFSDINKKISKYMVLRLRDCQDDPQHPTAFYAIGCNVGVNDFQRKLIIVEQDSVLEFVNFDIDTTNVYDVAPYRVPGHEDHDKLGKIYVGTNTGLYKFRDYLNAPWDSTRELPDRKILCLAERFFTDTTFTVYAGTENGGMLSYVKGWWRPFINLENSCIVHLEPWFSNNVNFQKIYAITCNSNIFYNDDIFQDWLPDPKNKNFPEAPINTFAAHEDEFDYPFIGTIDGVYNKIDNTNWKVVNDSGLIAHRIHAIVHDTSNDYDKLWAGTDSMIFYQNLDHASDWKKDFLFRHVITIAYHPQKDELYVGTKDQGVFWKEDGGDYNLLIEGGLTDSSKITNIVFDNKNNPKMYITTADGVIFERNNSNQWKMIDNLSPNTITSIALDSIYSSDTVYVSTDNRVYKIDTSRPDLSFFWNAQTYVNSLVFNSPDSLLFAGTTNGIKYNSVGYNSVGQTMNDYTLLSLTSENVQQLHIISTDPSFNGILYAMNSDSASRGSQIWRNVIGEKLREFVAGKTPNFKRQCGESFCVNLNDPNIVYMGTAGTGVFNYKFQYANSITIDSSILHFGEADFDVKKFKEFEIRNDNNDFMPLIVTAKLTGEHADSFHVESLDSVLYPGESVTCYLSFETGESGTFSSTLTLNWRDIFKKPVSTGTDSVILNATCNDADLAINGLTNDEYSFNYKIHIGLDTTETLAWEKIGDLKLDSFKTVAPIDTVHFNLIGNWDSTLNSDAKAGILQFNFHPDTILDTNNTIVIKFYKEKIPERKQLNLRGKGLDGILETDPDSIDFGKIPRHDHSIPPSIVWLHNIGNIPLTIDEYYIHPSESSFSINSVAVPDTLKPGDSGLIEIIFKPETIGIFLNSLVIISYDSAFASPDTNYVKLTGEGVKEMIDLYPDLDFGNVHFNNQPKQASLIIENISTQYTVWLDSQKLVIDTLFSIIKYPDADSLRPDTADSNQTDNKDTLYIEYGDITKDVRQLIHDDTDSDTLLVYYRYGKPDSIKKPSSKPDTLTGKIISSILEVNPTAWDTCACLFDSVYTRFRIKNSGNIPLYFKLIEMPDTPFYSNLKADHIYTIKEAREAYIRLGFKPNNDQIYFDSLSIHFRDLEDLTGVNETLIIPLKGEGLDCIPPIIDTVICSSPEWYKPFSVKSKIFDEHSGIKGDSTFLYYRIGGEFHFKNFPLIESGKNDSMFYTEIPGNFITSHGIEFFIEANDSSIYSGSAHSPSTGEFKYFSQEVIITDSGITHTYNYFKDGNAVPLRGGNAQQDYQLISIPLKLDSTKRSVVEILKSSIFSEYREHRWSCADYVLNPKNRAYSFSYTNSYEENYDFADFIHGKSFFLLITYRYPKQYLKPLKGRTITTANLFEIELHAQCNFIANPFNFPIPVKNVALKSNSNLTIYQYDGEWKPLGDQDLLKPWEGYAVNVEEDGTDILLISPNMNPDYGPAEMPGTLKKIEYQWHIIIESSCEHAKDNYNIAAVSKQARLKYDEYDESEPPPIGDYMMLSFPHPEWEKALNYFAVDVQPPDQDGNFWDFSVFTNISHSEVKISFKNMESVPTDFKVMLVCESIGRFQDLRQNNNFIYQSNSGHSEQKFRLLVGTEDFIKNNDLNIEALPKTYQLETSYPNPFNHATSIQYALPQQEQVTISIYNILGELVATLVEQDAKPVGKYIVTWDGTNSNGILVGSGIYFCRFKTPNFSKTIKMTLLK